MGRIPMNHIAQRWAPTAGAGVVPLITPIVFDGVSWPIAAAVSAAVMLLTALSTTARFILLEVLQHLRQVRQLRDQHREAMLRESNQHTEVMLLLGKVNDADAFDIDVARVVKRIRVIGPAATAQLPKSPTPTGTSVGPTSADDRLSTRIISDAR
jgi:hypothetical protein